MGHFCAFSISAESIIEWYVYCLLRYYLSIVDDRNYQLTETYFSETSVRRDVHRAETAQRQREAKGDRMHGKKVFNTNDFLFFRCITAPPISRLCQGIWCSHCLPVRQELNSVSEGLNCLGSKAEEQLTPGTQRRQRRSDKSILADRNRNHFSMMVNKRFCSSILF